MRFTRSIAAVIVLGLGVAATALADVVTDWNEAAVVAGYKANTGNSIHTRYMAMMHIAMFEALNSIEPRYAPYRAKLAVEPGTSREAAVASAAHYALVRQFPEQQKDFDAALQASLGAVADGPGKQAGIRLGQQAAEAMLAERRNDGADGPNTYRPFTTPGKYVPTMMPLSATWGSVRPFALRTGDQFRSPPPYALSSPQWAKDYEEIRRIGAKTGSTRTPEQTEIARFWQLTGPATYNPVARQLSAQRNLDLLDNARLFALASIAAADAAIAIFDAKYAHAFWRPVTAIRNGDIDGNDATQLDPAWEPFIATPMHPEYPCAHCTFQGAAAAVLQLLFGDAAKFSMTSTTAPGITRNFERLSDYVTEVINARIYEGVHYRTSGEAGARLGRQVGEYVVQNVLKPAR